VLLSSLSQIREKKQRLLGLPLPIRSFPNVLIRENITQVTSFVAVSLSAEIFRELLISCYSYLSLTTCMKSDVWTYVSDSQSGGADFHRSRHPCLWYLKYVFLHRSLGMLILSCKQSISASPEFTQFWRDQVTFISRGLKQSLTYGHPPELNLTVDLYYRRRMVICAQLKYQPFPIFWGDW